MSLLTKADGSAFDSNGLGMWFADAIEQAGLPDACVMHGLRKTAARMLAEIGCSAHEIASVAGHKSRASRSSATTRLLTRSGSPRRRFTGWNGAEIEPRVANTPLPEWQTEAKRLMQQ
jgi:integrase